MAAATATKRFSKQTMIDVLRKDIATYEKRRQFTTETGWAQVDGKGEEVNRDYGAYETLQSLLWMIENETY